MFKNHTVASAMIGWMRGPMAGARSWSLQLSHRSPLVTGFCEGGAKGDRGRLRIEGLASNWTIRPLF
jgi:hypothetical protein